MGSPKRVIIIGAGPGGLAAAMLLGKRGFDVRVFERADRVGGRCARLDIGPYGFDLGPTFLMMRYILDDLFEATGRRSDDYLQFIRLDPMYRLHFADGRTLDVTDDHERMRANLEAAFPGDGDGVRKFLESETIRYERLSPCFREDYSRFGRMFGPNMRRALPYLSLGRSVAGILKRYFRSPQAQVSFMFQTKYLGMSPWECPAAFGIIPYVEHAFGIWHVRGGLAEIPAAMAKAAEEDGVKIRLNAPVRRVLTRGRTATGIELESGERFDADAVVVNADFGTAVTELFPAESLRSWTRKRLEQSRLSCSTFMLYLGLDTVYPDLPHHNIVFAEDYRENIRQIFAGSEPPADPSFYVRNSGPRDPDLAPPGCSGLYVLVPMQNMRSGIDWGKEREALREKVLTAMEKRLGLTGLRDHVREERVIVPDQWESEMHVYRGATFNLAHNLGQMLWLRPHNRFDDIRNVYLVGGGTHPGSGLPTIFESGRISARLVEEDLK